MTRHVAFLRGINVGKRRVKMDHLRIHFEEFGLVNVSTFIASGNVVFDFPGRDFPGRDLTRLEKELEVHLEGALGFQTETFVRHLGRLEEITKLEVVEALVGDGFNPHVIFFQEEVGPPVEEGLGLLETADDRFHLLEREAIWFRRGGLSESPIKTNDLEKALGRRKNTTRNLNTIHRILEKFGEGK